MALYWENYVFHWEKWSFEPIGNFLHTTEYLALQKALYKIRTRKKESTTRSMNNNILSVLGFALLLQHINQP